MDPPANRRYSREVCGRAAHARHTTECREARPLRSRLGRCTKLQAHTGTSSPPGVRRAHVRALRCLRPHRHDSQPRPPNCRQASRSNPPRGAASPPASSGCPMASWVLATNRSAPTLQGPGTKGHLSNEWKEPMLGCHTRLRPAPRLPSAPAVTMPGLPSRRAQRACRRAQRLAERSLHLLDEHGNVRGESENVRHGICATMRRPV